MRKSTLFLTKISICCWNSFCTTSLPRPDMYDGVWEIFPATSASPSLATSRARSHAAWLISVHWKPQKIHKLRHISISFHYSSEGGWKSSAKYLEKKVKRNLSKPEHVIDVLGSWSRNAAERGQSGDWIENVLKSRRKNENSEDAKEITMLKQILKRPWTEATEIL